jgi:hypothetical protein
MQWKPLDGIVIPPPLAQSQKISPLEQLIAKAGVEFLDVAVLPRPPR